MTKANKNFNFIRNHDGSQEAIPDDEQQRAAQSFKELCEDVFLLNADDTASLAQSPYIDARALSIFKITGEDGSALLIYVNATWGVLSEHARPFDISLQEKDAEGKDRKLVRYELARDYTKVTRVDVSDDMHAKVQAFRAMDGPVPRGISTEFWQGEIERLKNEIENSKLEAAMGLNRQAIGEQEVRALTDLVMHAADINQ